jgi:predicted nuclease of predicted toxin-antitoxin system
LKLLLDENVPRPMAEIVRILLTAHDVVHVHELDGWAGTKDIELYAKAKTEGFQAIITNDAKQLNRHMEVEAIARSGLHRIQYRQNNKHGGLVGLGTAIATVCAALPHALAELEEADGQRLVFLTAIDPSRRSRLQVTDPAVEPPKHWPGR